MENNDLQLTASESVEQCCLFRWAGYSLGLHPELKLMYHIPNGGKRNITTARRLKAEGVKAGVPDIHLPVHTVFPLDPALEFHRSKCRLLPDIYEGFYFFTIFRHDNCQGVHAP